MGKFAWNSPDETEKSESEEVISGQDSESKEEAQKVSGRRLLTPRSNVRLRIRETGQEIQCGWKLAQELIARGRAETIE
jgi:hypothetical protein